MSMTKRYLHSLPQAEQDAILGRPDEWDDDAENEPEEASEMMRQMIEDEELWQWARALMEEDEDAFTERDESPMVKPAGKCVTLEDKNGVEWKL